MGRLVHFAALKLLACSGGRVRLHQALSILRFRLIDLRAELRNRLVLGLLVHFAASKLLACSGGLFRLHQVFLALSARVH